MNTKAKPKKRYDAVAMVREIRDAHYRRDTDPNFDVAELKRIKAKWTKLLEDDLKARKNVQEVSVGKQSIMEQLRDIREKMSLETAGMNFGELQAYLKSKGSLKDSLPTPKKRRARPAVRRRSSAKT